MTDDGPQTLIEAVRYFSDKKICAEYMVKIKWPDGVIRCPKCNGENVNLLTTRDIYKCRACRKQFSCKVDTIFEASPLGLDKWFVALWMIANCKNGISSLELHRAFGVTQKTAWFMLHRIRLAMRTGNFRKLHGIIESDETFVGGRATNMHHERREQVITGRGGVGKAIVHGLLERGSEDAKSQVRASVVPNTEAETLVPEILRNVERAAVVCTDAHASYADLQSQFVHRFIDHATRYVQGKVHVNGLENFWCLLKRMLKGTYVAVAPFHLFRYLDEESWRFNERGTNDGGRFARLLPGVVGKRITYRQLCAIGDCGFMGIE
jgi:transposase-like protein